jgi:crossover junction endodeoxyribonuclease RusA
MNQWAIKMPFSRPPLSLNDRHSSYFTERRAQQEVAHMVSAVARQAIKSGLLEPRPRIAVELLYYPGNNGRRDADNIAATLKPILDGLVDAKVIPDDKADHVVLTSQRIVLRRDDPHNRADSQCWVIVTDVRALPPMSHVPPGPPGTISWAMAT